MLTVISSWFTWRWLRKRGRKEILPGEKPVITPRYCLSEFRGSRSSPQHRVVCRVPRAPCNFYCPPMTVATGDTLSLPDVDQGSCSAAAAAASHDSNTCTAGRVPAGGRQPRPLPRLSPPVGATKTTGRHPAAEVWNARSGQRRRGTACLLGNDERARQFVVRIGRLFAAQVAWRADMPSIGKHQIPEGTLHVCWATATREGHQGRALSRRCVCWSPVFVLPSAGQLWYMIPEVAFPHVPHPVKPAQLMFLHHSIRDQRHQIC